MRRNVIITVLLFMLSPRLFSQDEKDTVNTPLLQCLLRRTRRRNGKHRRHLPISAKASSISGSSNTDVPGLLAQLPSMISFSAGGNGIGYNYVTLRGFDQSRLSIMVNGIPQDDPKIKVYTGSTFQTS